jgi:phosphonate transport system permease protein
LISSIHKAKRFIFGLAYFLALILGAVLLANSASSFSASNLARVPDLFLPAEFLAPTLLISAALETLGFAVAGTVLGFVCALFFSIAIYRLPSLARLAVTLPAWIARGVPDVVFAVLLAQVLGLGPLTGMLALALGTFGVSTKLVSITLLTHRTKIDNNFAQSGMGPVWFTLGVLIPSVFRDLASQFLLRLEVNFRIAVVLGLVGGGGLGLLLSSSMGLLDYQTAAGTVLAIVIFVLATESLSRRIRERASASAKSIHKSFSFAIAPWLLGIFLVGFTLVTLSSGSHRFSLGQAERLVAAALSPDFSSQSEPLWSGLIESIGLASLASLFAFPLALTLALLSSSRITQATGLSSWVRGALGLFRSVPIAVLAILLVVPFGLGFSTALIALVLGGTLFLARVIADSLDDYAVGVVESFSRSGASFLTRSQVAIVSNMRRLSASWFFTLDFLFRYSVILGILGAGGLGQVILSAVRVQDLNTVVAATILIVGVVALLELAEAPPSKAGTRSRNRSTA